MKTYLKFSLICFSFIAVIFLYQKISSVEIGMAKEDVLKIVKPEIFTSRPAEANPDTLVAVLPNAWNGSQPQGQYVLIFESDTLKSFQSLSL